MRLRKPALSFHHSSAPAALLAPLEVNISNSTLVHGCTELVGLPGCMQPLLAGTAEVVLTLLCNMTVHSISSITLLNPKPPAFIVNVDKHTLHRCMLFKFGTHAWPGLSCIHMQPNHLEPPTTWTIPIKPYKHILSELDAHTRVCVADLTSDEPPHVIPACVFDEGFLQRQRKGRQGRCDISQCLEFSFRRFHWHAVTRPVTKSDTCVGALSACLL